MHTFILILLSSAVFRLQKCVSDFFNLFCSEDKKLLSEFLRKWGWFRRHNERFPKYFCLKIKISKTETRICRWKSTDDNHNILCHWKRKDLKTHFYTNSELSENRTEKKIIPSKSTINWLFNNIWCYLFITGFR